MKVHVLCPASSVTGGPEALHQFVDAGQQLGFDIGMVYLPEDDPDPTPAVFRLYAPRIWRDLADAPGNAVVVPETGTAQLLSLRHATRVHWWLSVEHFQLRAEAMRQAQGGGASAASPLDFVFDPRFGVVHLTQSEYARQWVERQGAPALMLTDYIRDEIVERARRLRTGPKDPLVAYNPKKGLEFTQRLMAASPPDITWVPIENMSPAEVAALLGRARAYVDFGPHPGRDRIPREAVLCGCTVITNTQGSAANGVDVPLPPSLKFDERHPLTVPQVLQRLREALTQPQRFAEPMAAYCRWVEDQRRVFFDEVFTVLATLEAQAAQRARRSA
ncbi:hypothetical protein [Ideonella livida]|uniref:Glycosyltransferase n=1 Tax=Ideonella livida TaxID=2707176 RepID=A0A7C9PKN1_9BURK|nr:hypothetical protein [Ideonella livida]NDY93711.1 hypothetical protein [Ideonella livida]